MEDYKEETKRAYDSCPESFERRFKHLFQFVRPHADLFLGNLPGKKIVDLGSGPGIHAQYFSQRGYEVLCTDISEEMLKLCQEKGLEIKLMNLEEIKLPEKEFDGAWACASFLHVQREIVPLAVGKVSCSLKQKGLLSLSVKEGRGERFEIYQTSPEIKRWFVYFDDEEVRKYTEPHFNCLHFSRTKGRKGEVFLDYLFQLK